MAQSREDRMQGLVEILQRDERASVSELASAMAVTEMTIRRDLEVLEKDGVLERFHGGARLLVSSSYEPPILLREKMHSEDKRALGRAVAEFVRDGDTLILDGGTTGIAIARALTKRRLVICPLSLRVAWEFEQSNSVTLRMPPGVARTGELSLSGPDTIDYLRRHHFDHYVMTASGFSLGAGLTEWNSEDAAVKRVALGSAKRTTAAVDASKFGRDAFATICDLQAPASVLVSGLTPGEETDSLRRAVPTLREV